MKYQTTSTPKRLIFFLFSFVITGNLYAQETLGVPIHLGPGITKTIDEIKEYGKNNAAEDLKPPVFADKELELPEKLSSASNPAWNISSWPIPDKTNTINGVTSGSPAPVIWSNFLATDFSTHSGGWPPDNNGDVGTTQIFISQNFRFRVYSKPSVTAAAVTTPNGSSTTLLAGAVMDISTNNFFRTAFAGVNTTDPHIRFDRLSSRWFIVAQSTNEATNNYLLFAVSSGATIAGTVSFTFFRVTLSSFPAGNADIGKFLDYPTLGVDKNSLYLGGNIFTSSSGSYSHSSLYVVNKADMIAGTLTITPFSAAGNGTAGKDIITAQGVNNDDPATTEGYFAGESASVYTRLVMKRITYSGTTPIMSADIYVTIPANQNSVGQPALGSSSTLDAVGGRYYAAMVTKNKITNTATLWLAETIGVNSAALSANATNDRNAARWLEIKNLTTTPALNQAGTLFNNAAANPRGFWVPSIAMSGQGHAVMVSSTAAANARCDINIAERYRTTTLGTLVDTVPVTVSADAYNPMSPTFVNRWGDYSQVGIDPLDNMTMWAFHEYCNTANSYGVRAIQIKAPAPATPSLATVPGCGAGVAVTINGTSVNNTEFFDPGADAGGPGFTRLTIACSGGIAVTGTTFVSPTQLTCFLDTRGKASGTYTLTVTNPDGQAVSVNFTLAVACPLPITLLSFKGNLANKQAYLNWSSVGEYGLKKYDVEKSIDGANFNYLDAVPAKNLANTQNDYQLIDKDPYPGYNYYRLKMIDMDGQFKYSDIVKLQTERKSIAVTKMYPNPLHDNFNIEVFTEKSTNIQVEVFDVSGKTIINKKVNLQAGVNNYQLNLAAITPGSYIITIKDIDGKIIEKEKLVKE